MTIQTASITIYRYRLMQAVYVPDNTAEKTERILRWLKIKRR